MLCTHPLFPASRNRGTESDDLVGTTMNVYIYSQTRKIHIWPGLGSHLDWESKSLTIVTFICSANLDISADTFSQDPAKHDRCLMDVAKRGQCYSKKPARDVIAPLAGL